MSFVVARIGDLAVAEADQRELRVTLRRQTIDEVPNLRSATSSVEAQLLLDVEQIVDRELGEIDADTLRIDWKVYESALREGLDLVSRWVEFSPYLLSIDRESEIGRRDFEYHYSFLLGGRPVAVERSGYFVRQKDSSRVFMLEPRTFALLDAMDRFNATPAAEKTPADAWEAFAVIRQDADALGVRLDEYLESNTVVVPSSIALDYDYHADGSLSFVPRCPELSSNEFATVFHRNAHAERVYSLDGVGGRRVRIVLNKKQREVLSRMKQVRHVRDAEKRIAEESPEAFFDGVLDDVEIRYGSRVTGVGELKFASMPANAQGVSLLDQVIAGHGSDRAIDATSNFPSTQSQEGKPGDDHALAAPAKIALRRASDGASVPAEFRSVAALRSFRDRVAAAVARGITSIDYGDTIVSIDPELVDALSRPAASPAAASLLAVRESGRKYLLIYTNEEELVAEDVARLDAPSDGPVVTEFSLPLSLSPDVLLKPHQIEGVRWLQRCNALVPNRRGALLADDMGLGKTLQVLVHLARLIESGGIKDQQDQGEDAPWRPILIVAPLMLVENETWPREMCDRFRDDGEIFRPILTLHGDSVAKVRRAQSEKGRETVIGRPVLDAAKLMQYRVIVTTYETVVNYQHSFAQLVDGRPIWSLIVADEAQRYKMPNTKVSVALKALPTRFHIASTGTPVENRLLDLWNIMDTVQPALLGTATDFNREFERQLKKPEADQRLVLDQLRARLHFRTPHAFVIRRSKSELTDLPLKTERRVISQMSREEHEANAACLDQLKGESAPGKHLAVLQRLALLSQHLLLTSDGFPSLSVDELVSASPKIQSVLAVLERIREKQEKVILFARHVSVQNLLALVIGRRMGIRVPIINGTTSGVPESARSSERTKRTRAGRKRVLDEFKSGDGFGAIVLSPFVAGVGLTITEANHVIHYGRWWNPAVEGQATDRAYRIGQQRPVTVYYPILEDPWGAADASFDQVLDRLLERKRALAQDFLHPTADEDTAAGELRDELLGATRARSDAPSVLNAASVNRLSPSDFEALVSAVFAGDAASTVLTCRSGDGGADVLALRQGVGSIIQVKQVRPGAEVGAEAVADIIAAADTYANAVEGAAWTPWVVTNGRFSRECERQAARIGVSLMTGSDLMARVEAQRVTLATVLSAAERRCSSFADGINRTREMMRT